MYKVPNLQNAQSAKSGDFFFHMKIQKSMVVEHWSAFTVLSLLLKRERETAIKMMLCACRQYSQIMRVFFRLQNYLHTGTPPLIGTITINKWFPVLQCTKSGDKMHTHAKIKLPTEQ